MGSIMSETRIKLLAQQQFFAILAMELKVEEDPTIPTACVTLEKKLRYNPKWFEGMDDPLMRMGVVCHEVLHCALDLFGRMGDRDQELSNIAHDFIVNGIVSDCGMPVVEDALFDEQLKNFSFEVLYELLHKEKEEQQKNCSGDEGGGSSCSKKHKGSAEKSAHDWMEKLKDKTPQCVNFDNVENMSESDLTRIRNEWQIAMAGAKQKMEQQNGWGSLPSNLRQIVDNMIEPKLDWKQLLSRWVGNNGRADDYSYRRPSRRISMGGIISPTLRGNMADVAILVDTSGSMHGNPINEVASEIWAIVDDLKCAAFVISCDAEVHSVIESPADMESVLEELEGGGGSDFRPAFENLRERNYHGPVIAATDGDIYVPYEQPDGIDVLWLIPKRGHPPARWGEAIHIDV